MPLQHKTTFSRKKFMALASATVSMVSWSHDLAARAPQLEIAKTSIEIHNNTFRAPQRAVVIRGTPEERCDTYQK